MKLPILLAVLVAASASAVLPAAAEVRPARNTPDAFETTVRFSDLDLNRAAGAELMLARLNRAARAVCGDVPHPNDIARRARHRACIAETVDNAVAGLDAPVVTARHTGRMSARMASN